MIGSKKLVPRMKPNEEREPILPKNRHFSGQSNTEAQATRTSVRLSHRKVKSNLVAGQTRLFGVGQK